MQPQWEKKSRFLTQLLIWSGAINIGLLSSLVYLVLRDRPETISFDLRPVATTKVIQATNQDILSQFSTLSWAELVAQLENVDLVEEGYKKEIWLLPAWWRSMDLILSGRCKDLPFKNGALRSPAKKGLKKLI